VEYALLIYSDAKNTFDVMTDAEREAFFVDMRAFHQALVDAGLFREARRLRPADTATTVRLRAGKPVPTDGPFAETRETLGGFFLIDCKDLDEALSWAGRLPAGRFGPIEVRPVH
jgi:hypothetical protein